MSLIEVERALEGALDDRKVRRKPNRTGSLRAKASRVARGSPEVMVKITGFGKSAEHLAAHVRYITRNAKLGLETDRGEIVRDKEAVKDLLVDWSEDIDLTARRGRQRRTMHLVLSMPEGTPETAVRDAACMYAKRSFGANHEYAFTLHTDEPHPHVHLIVKMAGFDGRMLNPRKADLHAWREAFAREMRDQGIDAEATLRSSRGVVRKAENSIVRHIEHGDEWRPPRVSRTKAARVDEVVQELIAEANGRPVSEKPWEAHIKRRQQTVRAAWLAAATALEEDALHFKEPSNVSPEYDRLVPGRVQAGQRAAAVYQSHLERDVLRTPAVALARMRDVSRLDMVQHQRPAQVLLHAHAFDGVGRYGGPDHDLRRPRTCALTSTTGLGSDRDGRGGVAMTDRQQKQSLAATIRTFVHTMPPIETAVDGLKRDLARRFTRRDRDERVTPVAPDMAEPHDVRSRSVER